MSNPAAKPLRFYRVGGLDQMQFETGADIAALAALDRKLWVALACPVKGLEFDERTLALIDTDGDGRVRAAEVVAAVGFLSARLKSLDTLIAGSDSLPLAALDEGTAEGREALASARRILANLGRDGADAISVADVADPAKFFAGTRFNGDGVITAASADDADTAAVIAEIIASQGATADRAGADGASRAAIEAFFAEARALADWLAAGADATTQPLGADTAAALAALNAVRAKVDDYFARTRLAAFDPRALQAVNRAEADYLAVAAGDLSISAAEVAGFPLARVEAGRPLPLDGGLNPAWAAAVAALRQQTVQPLLGELRELTEAQWRELDAKLAAHAAWAGSRPVGKLGALADARVQAILASGAESRLLELLARDEALAAETSAMDAVEKLVRLNRDLIRLLHNFVSFGDFYSGERLAMFQAGHLFLDSRECALCLRIDDAGKHAALAGLSKCYLAYCDLSRKGAAGTEKMSVLAVFTQGDSDFLTVGRNGLFVDRKGQDWDATIVKIIDAPISIRQAFFAPYKKFVRMIEEQVAKRAAAADAAADAKLAEHATSLAHADKAAAATAPAAPAGAPAAPKKIDLGTIALIGTAISGVAAMVGLVLEKFFGLGVYMPLGLAAIVLLISGPSMLIAALKLRQRSLGPILDASGWAINGRVRVNIPFGAALTRLAKLPQNSSLSLQDPFREKKSPWPTVLAVAAVVLMAGWTAYSKSWLARWLPASASASAPVAAEAPAAAPAP